MPGEMMEDKITFFKSFYITLKKLKTAEEKAEYIEGLLGFAFEGVEPDFEEGSNLDFAFTNQRDNIKATKKRAQTNRENGRQHTANPSDNPTGNPSENPSDNPRKKATKPKAKSSPIQDKERDRDKEKEGDFSLPSEEEKNPPATTVGAAGAEAPPPSVAKDQSAAPVCPLCSKPIRLRASPGGGVRWHCELCGDVKEPRFEAVG